MTGVDLIRPASGGLWGLQTSDGGLTRYPPEPRNATGTWLETAKNVGKTVLNSAISTTSAFGSGADFQQLLNQQLEVQVVMQQVSMQSNVSKSEHETLMAPIRNLRVG